MAAITWHQEIPAQADPEELDYADCDAAKTYGVGLRGLNGLGAAKRTCPTTTEIVSTRYRNLGALAILRQSLAQVLTGRSMRVVQRGSAFFVELDPRVLKEDVPQWNTLGPPFFSQVELLTETTKMAAPSFSLPAGSSEIAGACPGAGAGQPLVQLDRGTAAYIAKMTDYQPADLTQWYADAVCSACYATTGNYKYSNGTLKSMLLHAWTQHALTTKTQGGASNMFVDVMVQAIDRSNIFKREPAHTARYGRFFRIHDSGDFDTIPYLMAWLTIADHFAPGNACGYEPVRFWAPTRMWVFPKWTKKVASHIAAVPNITVRPSSYHINRKVPRASDLSEGFANGSVVCTKELTKKAEGALYTWNCKAYEASDAQAHTCLHARDVDGNLGCRMCWLNPEHTINYTLHGAKHAEE